MTARIPANELPPAQHWTFYDQLLAYQDAPSPEQVPRLEAEFDDLFSTVTGYTGLDRRIAMTQDKKQSF